MDRVCNLHGYKIYLLLIQNLHIRGASPGAVEPISEAEPSFCCCIDYCLFLYLLSMNSPIRDKEEENLFTILANSSVVD